MELNHYDQAISIPTAFDSSLFQEWANSYSESFGACTPPSPLVRPDDVGGPNTWRLLVHDGALLPVYDMVAVAPETVLTPELRAAALRHAIPSGLIVAGVTAAWIYVGAAELVTLELATRSGANRRVSPQPNMDIWSTVGLDSTAVTIAGVKVTDPHRTVADLAWRQPTEVALYWISKLVAAGVNLKAATLAMERRHRVIGRSRIREVLNLAATPSA